jgi:hypothetical protein
VSDEGTFFMTAEEKCAQQHARADTAEARVREAERELALRVDYASKVRKQSVEIERLMNELRILRRERAEDGARLDWLSMMVAPENWANLTIGWLANEDGSFIGSTCTIRRAHAPGIFGEGGGTLRAAIDSARSVNGPASVEIHNEVAEAFDNARTAALSRTAGTDEGSEG